MTSLPLYLVASVHNQTPRREVFIYIRNVTGSWKKKTNKEKTSEKGVSSGATGSSTEGFKQTFVITRSFNMYGTSA